MNAPPRTTIPRLSELDLVVETARLRLRPLAATDVEALWPYVSDPEFPKLMSWAAHTDRKETAEFLARQAEGLANGTDLAWAIEHEGVVVGCVGFHGITWQLRAWRLDRAELGYWLAPALWGKGLMTEGARGAIQFGFDTLRLHKVTVGCLLENDASRKVINKLGFRHVGKQVDDVWREGRWWSHLRYELTMADWSDVSTTMPITRLPVA